MYRKDLVHSDMFSKIKGFTAIIAILLGLAGIGLIASGDASADDSDLWQALRSPGHVALIRHALAPGTGDPADFKIGKCETQRNLSQKGRAQARRIGRRFRVNGIKKALVYTSQWCRCKETAELLELGPVIELPIINSFFRNFQLEGTQTRQLSEWLRKQELKQPTVLVTHQVNITAFTSIFPASGEMVIIRRTDTGEFVVAGTIQTD
jgi:phosphohistidine phosphatase SixA